MTGQIASTGETVELKPFVPSSGTFNGLWFGIENSEFDYDVWSVAYFEGKSNRITFRKYGESGEFPEITSITLRPAPTMTFLNPRPAPGSPSYPWRWDGGEHNHYIKLPLPLTYLELSQGSQIVVSGVTEGLNVIEGVVEENNEIHFRAGGALIASVVQYNGERDLVQIIVMEDFAGEILAVNFDKAYKNVPDEQGIYLDAVHDGILTYQSGSNPFAKCILNGVVISDAPPYMPSNGLLGNLVFQSKYIADYGNVIESYYWNNERYLYVIRMDDTFKFSAVAQTSTSSPLEFPVF